MFSAHTCVRLETCKLSFYMVIYFFIEIGGLMYTPEHQNVLVHDKLSFI